MEYGNIFQEVMNTLTLLAEFQEVINTLILLAEFNQLHKKG